MQNTRKIAEDTYWLGYSDRRLELFENLYPVPRGMSYNSYLILDEKTVLMDGMDCAGIHSYLEDLEDLLSGRHLDYMVIQHMEPDHAAVIRDLVKLHPDLKLVGNAKTKKMLGQFFGEELAAGMVLVGDEDVLRVGKHELHFVFAPMVHWPEVMVTFDAYDGVLFSADAFGTFGALSGNLYADEVGWGEEWIDEARRYYANIVGKYGIQTVRLLSRAESLPIRMILPLHGPIWRRDLSSFMDLYKKWGACQPEKQSVAIYYGSVYGDTQNAAEILAAFLAERGVRQMRVMDVSKTSLSECVARAFEYSHLVFASTTYNADLFINMKTLLDDLANHALQNRTVGIIENGTWAPLAGAKMKEILSSMKNVTILEPLVTLHSSVKRENVEQLRQLADAIADSLQ